MAAYNGMGQIPLRDELKRRGLLVRGRVNQLRQRLARDDTLGIFDGYLGSMSETDMEDACQRRFIPIDGRHEDRRERLFKKLKRYNERKGGVQANSEVAGGWLNSGLPTPADRLGAQSEEPILGTPNSGITFQPYIDYIEAYKQQNGTTEAALTFRYWRICQHPGVALHRLWPIRHADCRVL